MRVREFELGDGEAVHGLRRLSFGGHREFDPDWVEAERGWTGFVAEWDGLVVGFARFWRHRQFFGRVGVPMGGVASVCVAPHARGAGVACALLEAAIERMYSDGIAVSALYPSVPAVYRSRGWENVGVRQHLEVPTAVLPRCRGGMSRPAAVADLPAMVDAYQAVAATVDGMVDRSTRVFGAEDFLGGDVADIVPGGSGIDGYLLANRSDDQLMVYDLVASDVPAADVLLGSLASWSGQLSSVVLRVLDPMVHDLLLPLPDVYPVYTRPWMLRVIDLPTAIAARGWPYTNVLKPFSLDIDVDDKHAPWQHGRYRLVCEDGIVRCEPGGTGVIRMTARGLAAWYAGAAAAETLRRGRLIECETDDATALDTLTGAPHSLRMADAF